MKKMIALGAVFAASLACNASAQEVDYLGASSKVLAEANAQAADLPPNVLLVELERWRWKENTFSARPITTSGQRHPGKREGILGYVSFLQFEGSTPLFACLSNNWMDSFTSLQEDCEGHMKTTNGMPVTGYVASTQIPGTVPLYRCTRNIPKVNTYNDHFDTLDPNCEGKYQAVFEGILGYIWL